MSAKKKRDGQLKAPGGLTKALFVYVTPQMHAAVQRRARELSKAWDQKHSMGDVVRIAITTYCSRR